MAFAISTKSTEKGPRSHSTIHVATAKDYERKKLALKHEIKFERDYDSLERKMISRAKWHQRAENNNLRQDFINNNHPERPTTSLDDFIQRERIKQDNVINSKRVGNERIRRSSINTLPKV